MSSLSPLPGAITARTGPIDSAERALIGESSFVYILTGPRGRFVLKVDRRPEHIALREREAVVLAALRNHRPLVAELLARTERDGESYFLFSYVRGEDMVHAVQESGPGQRSRLMAEYGRTLRRIHSWQPDLPRPQGWLDGALARVTANIAGWPQGATVGTPGAYAERDARELLAEVTARRPTIHEDIVFCHGDYCLPNVLVEGERTTGIIDWPDGGYADRRLDLATGLWSIGYNLQDPAYRRPFLEAYGYAGSLEELEFFEALYVLL